jgi:hypothetical protein
MWKEGTTSMHKKTKLLIWMLIGISIISIGLNIILAHRYGLVGKLQNRVGRFLKSPDKSLSEPYSERDNKPIVFHLTSNGIRRVSQSSGFAKKDIPNQLVIQPDVYDFSGDCYSLNSEGLYRFLLPGKVNAQRIVYQNDLDALLSAISWITTHGNSDNKKSNIELSDKALHSKLFITCGHISKWAHHLLTDLNVKSRLVAGITTDDWNTYNNGHTLIEVWRENWGKWVLYDLDNNSYFISSRGDEPLSIVEFSQSVATNDYEIIYLSSDTRLDASSFTSSDGYDYSFFSEEVNVNIRDWYRRVMQVPLIFDESEKKYFFMDQSNKDRIESYSASYQYINKSEFLSRFYRSKY